MSNSRRTERLFHVVDRAINRIDSTLGYARTVEALRLLADSVSEDEESDWYLGEGGSCDLASLIAGAYWHFSEWHAGQSSNSYAAMCALGGIFSPGMSDGPEPESCELDVFEQLATMAEGAS